MATNLIKFTRALSATFELADIDQLLELYSDYICAPAAIQDHFKELQTKILADMRRLAALTTNADYKATLDALLAGHPAEYSDLISLEPAETVDDYAKRSIADMYKLIRVTFPFAPVDPAAVDRNLKELCKVFKSMYRYRDRLYLSELNINESTPYRPINVIGLGGGCFSLCRGNIDFIKHNFNKLYIYNTPILLIGAEEYRGDIDIKHIIKIGFGMCKNKIPEEKWNLGRLTNRLAGFWYLLAEIAELRKDLKTCAGNDVKAKCRIELFNAIKLEYDWPAIAQVAAEPPPSGPESEYDVLNYMIANHMEWFYSMLATRPYSALTDEEINTMAK